MLRAPAAIVLALSALVLAAMAVNLLARSRRDHRKNADMDESDESAVIDIEYSWINGRRMAVVSCDNSAHVAVVGFDPRTCTLLDAEGMPEWLADDVLEGFLEEHPGKAEA